MLALAALPTVGILGWGLRNGVDRWLDAKAKDPRFDEPSVPLPDAPNVARLRQLAQAIAPLFSKLPEPQPDDWLAKHFEFGQTFIQFVSSFPDKLSDQFKRICIVPLGELSDTEHQLFTETAKYLEWFFGFPVEPLESVAIDDLPDDAQQVRESGRRQLLTTHLLNEVLLPLCDDDTAAVFGISVHDLWFEDFNFLFGQGSPIGRVAVGSVARFGDADKGASEYAACLRRIVGLAVHEIGHVFHLPHCIAYSCRMNGSNHLAESDARPLEFCPECLPKIWWTCGMDPGDRFARLAEFADEHRLIADEKLWRSAQTRLAAAQKLAT